MLKADDNNNNRSSLLGFSTMGMCQELDMIFFIYSSQCSDAVDAIT